MRFHRPIEWFAWVWLVLLVPAAGGAADVRKPMDTPAHGAAHRRQAHPLSPQAILNAIQLDLAQKGATRSALQVGDLRIQSAVPALRSDAGLQVRKITYDLLRREIVFQLWAANEPEYLPFQVTARRDPSALGLKAVAGWRGDDVNAAGAHKPGEEPPMVLAKPRTVATLVMLGQNVRVTTAVEPLQPGIKGQRILVRDLDTKRIMSAQVVGRSLLETEF